MRAGVSIIMEWSESPKWGWSDGLYGALEFVYTRSRILAPLVRKSTCWWSLGKIDFYMVEVACNYEKNLRCAEITGR